MSYVKVVGLTCAICTECRDNPPKGDQPCSRCGLTPEQVQNAK